MEGHDRIGGLLGPDEVSRLESFVGDVTTDCSGMLEYLGGFITRGIAEGRFTERQAQSDLGIALWVGYACTNLGDYEHFYTAYEWLSRVEDQAAGCGVWYYRYANALMYCGRPGMALEYCERGIREEPDYPWLWLTLGRLRHHYGDARGASEAVAKGLDLVPDDHEFLTLRSDIMAGATLEDMEMHYIDPVSDAELQAMGPSDPEYVYKRRAVDGIVCDRPGLEAIRSRLGVRGWSADHPYCTYLMDRGEGSLMVTFMMNEALLSKKDPGSVARIFDNLDRMDAEARERLSPGPGSLFGLSIGPDLEAKLSYALPGGEDVRDVDFDSDLELLDVSRGGPFAAILLLSRPAWDPDSIVRALREEWGVEIHDTEVDGDTMIGLLGPHIVAVSLIDSPVPGDEAEENASNNYLWPGAVEAARAHRAHLVVAMVNHGGDPVECGMTFTKLVSACSRGPEVLGVYSCGTVFEPARYIDNAGVMHDGEIPLDDMVWFGMYRTEDGINAYTVGMRAFGRDEMEVVGAEDRPQRVAAFLYDIAYHILSTGAVFRDGDTLGFEDGQSLEVRRGPGVSIDGDTLKIRYPDVDD